MSEPELRDRIVSTLEGHGLTDDPATYDSDIHSWRCAYPAIYGRCQCFEELADALVATVREPHA